MLKRLSGNIEGIEMHPRDFSPVMVSTCIGRDNIILVPEAALFLVSTRNRDLWPSQRSNDWSCAWFEPFRSLPVTLLVTFPRCSAQSNSATSTSYGTNCASVCEWNIVGHFSVRGWIITLMPYHVWMKTFMALNGKGKIQFEFNYHDKDTSLHVSLATKT